MIAIPPMTTATAAPFAPMTFREVLGPLSGVFVDRWPVKPTLIASDLIRAGLALLLFVATSMTTRWRASPSRAATSMASDSVNWNRRDALTDAKPTTRGTAASTEARSRVGSMVIPTAGVWIRLP